MIQQPTEHSQSVRLTLDAARRNAAVRRAVLVDSGCEGWVQSKEPSAVAASAAARRV